MLSSTKSRFCGKTLLQTLFFFLLVTQIGFGQWYQQNSGTTKNLRDVAFLNAYTGIAVGDSGLILRTRNGGALWSVIPTNVYDNLTSVSFVDDENGWVIGFSWDSYSSVILRTTDGGLNWYEQGRFFLKVNDIFFVDQNNGFVGGGYPGNIVSTFLLTTDGGETWSDSTASPTSSVIQQIYFVEPNIGWIVAYGCWTLVCPSEIYRTTDGGDTWQEQMNVSPCHLHDISFIDAQNGIVVGTKWMSGGIWPGVIYRTTDGGETWLENLGPPFVECTFIDVFQISGSVNAMWGNYDHGGNYDSGDVFYWSTDSGVTWQLRDSIQFILPLHINRIFFTDISNGWAVGDGGIILHTTNGGVSFIEEKEIDEVPTEFLLSQNYPNPFNPSTKIKYSVPQSSNVVIKVFDILGNEIETLVSEEKPAGTYEVRWYAEQLPSGVYFYQLKVGSFIETKKMLLLK